MPETTHIRARDHSYTRQRSHIRARGHSYTRQSRARDSSGTHCLRPCEYALLLLSCEALIVRRQKERNCHAPSVRLGKMLSDRPCRTNCNVELFFDFEISWQVREPIHHHEVRHLFERELLDCKETTSVSVISQPRRRLRMKSASPSSQTRTCHRRLTGARVLQHATNLHVIGPGTAVAACQRRSDGEAEG